VKPLQWEIVTDACPAVNPETGGYCTRRGRGELGPHEGTHWHDVWEYDPEAGENVITGWTEWDDSGSPS